MARTKCALSSTAIAMAFATSVGIVEAPASAQTAALADKADSGEIVVTARKRAEDILKTPVSVSALTSEDLERRNIVSLNDIAKNTPGLDISDNNSGRNDRSFQQITLRGFTPSTSNSILTSSFIDGVAVSSPTALNTITDPERIEILKGPQSAYFGRNTFAGAINVVNKLPGNDLAGSVSAIVGTRELFDVTGAIEGALVPDLLSIRVTGRSFSQSGSYVNQANKGQRLGDQKTASGTALIVLKPSSNLTVKAFGLYSENHDGPSAQGQLSAYEVRSNNGALNVPFVSKNNNGTVILPSVSNCTLNGFTSGLAATEARVARPFVCGALPGLPAGFSPAQNTLVNSLVNKFLANGSFRVVSPSEGVQGYGLKSQYYHLHMNIDWEIPDTGITLSSLTGYNHEIFSELADLDNYDTSTLRNAAYITTAFPNGNPNVLPYYDFPFLVERLTRDFSQEFRASYDNGGRLHGVVGASYLYSYAAGDLVSGNSEFVLGLPTRAPTSRSAPQQSKTLGAFFGLTYDVTDALSVSAEGRYQQDEIFAFSGGNLTGLTISASNTFGLPGGTFGPLTQFFSKKFRKFLPRAIVKYQFTPDVMAYASYSEGSNVSLSSFNTSFLNGSQIIKDAAAAIQLGVIVQPERLKNYEVGMKGKFFDGKLRASLAAYYAEWTNQQNQRSIVVNDTPAGYVAGTACPAPSTCSVAIVSGVANSGRTNLKGVELDLTATPVEGLSINASGAINDSNIRSFTDPAISKFTGLIGGDFRGHQTPASSKYSAAVGVQYGTGIKGWDDGSWFVRGDFYYKSKQYSDPGNLTWISARKPVNFRVGVAKGPFSLEGFVNNAFNDRNYVSILYNAVLTPDFSIAGTNGYLVVGLPVLRIFGVRAGFKF